MSGNNIKWSNNSSNKLSIRKNKDQLKQFKQYTYR